MMLDVPLEVPLQEDSFSCVPRCVKMILQYIKERLNGKIPSISLEDIGEVIETCEDGTYPDKVANLNNDKRILKSSPSIEFNYDQKMHSIKEIEDELNSGRPVIAWTELTDNSHSCGHAVVITGIDISQSVIYYNDPILGKKMEDLSVFTSKWDSIFRILITVRIGQRRILDEFY
jgi:hypothetical protein